MSWDPDFIPRFKRQLKLANPLSGMEVFQGADQGFDMRDYRDVVNRKLAGYFALVDMNGNGQLEPTEIQAFRLNAFPRLNSYFDTDNNGVVDNEELEEGISMLLDPWMVVALENADTNQDGVLTTDEYSHTAHMEISQLISTRRSTDPLRAEVNEADFNILFALLDMPADPSSDSTTRNFLHVTCGSIADVMTNATSGGGRGRHAR
eukprot:323829_1